MKRLRAAVILIVLSLGVARAGEGWPLQLGIFPPVQLIPEDMAVRGIKLNLPYSANDRVVGIDVGVASAGADMEVLQVNLYNRVYGEMTGLQVGLLDTIGSGNGLQIGLLNRVSTVFQGIQISLINVAEEMTGVQIGVINRTEFLSGLQIGVVNVIEESPLPFLPIINMSF
jgi:hypothetical protein